MGEAGSPVAAISVRYDVTGGTQRERNREMQRGEKQKYTYR